MNPTPTRSSRARGRTRPRNDGPRPAAARPVQRVLPPVAEDNAFVQLGVPNPIAAQLASTGITDPFPIQTATLPETLAGHDVLGRGRTGSGKTVAFAIPLVASLAASSTARSAPGRPRGLVLVPTRELANQVTEVIEPLASAMSLTVATVIGGVGYGPQTNALRRGVDIIVACPGRLEDLIAQGACRLDNVLVTAVDEADLMSDLGFLPAVRRILGATPERGQRLLFSATLDNAVREIVDRFLSDPIVHSPDAELAVGSAMQHHVLGVGQADKAAIVRALVSGDEKVVLFTRTKRSAAKLAKQLTAGGEAAVELHGNLSQNARERNLTMFRSGRSRVLVATDIAARGIHIDDVPLVVHVDPPTEHKTYLHRSGRTARAGANGTVVTLATPDQSRAVRALTKAAGVEPMFTSVAPGHSLLGDLARNEAVAVATPAEPRSDVRVDAAGPKSAARHRRRRPAQAGRGR